VIYLSAVGDGLRQ